MPITLHEGRVSVQLTSLLSLSSRPSLRTLAHSQPASFSQLSAMHIFKLLQTLAKCCGGCECESELSGTLRHWVSEGSGCVWISLDWNQEVVRAAQGTMVYYGCQMGGTGNEHLGEETLIHLSSSPVLLSLVFITGCRVLGPILVLFLAFYAQVSVIGTPTECHRTWKTQRLSSP